MNVTLENTTMTFRLCSSLEYDRMIALRSSNPEFNDINIYQINSGDRKHAELAPFESICGVRFHSKLEIYDNEASLQKFLSFVKFADLIKSQSQQSDMSVSYGPDDWLKIKNDAHASTLFENVRTFF